MRLTHGPVLGLIAAGRSLSTPHTSGSPYLNEGRVPKGGGQPMSLGHALVTVLPWPRGCQPSSDACMPAAARGLPVARGARDRPRTV